MTPRQVYREALDLRGIPRRMQYEAEAWGDMETPWGKVNMDRDVPPALLPLLRLAMGKIADDVYGELRDRQ